MTTRYWITPLGMRALAACRFEITPAGRRALATEPDQGELPVCDFCLEPFQPDEPIIAAGAGRHLHDTPSCRGAFETFIAEGGNG